ncbi:MAG: DUF5715 family protein [bacterium]|nr:DUF5715 family protein [bacterium]
MMRLLVALCAFVVSSPALAQVSLNAYADRGLEREGEAVKRFNLTRLTDQEMLKRLISQGHLVEVPKRGKGFTLGSIGGHASRNRHLYRYVRTYTKRFIVRFSEQYAARFGRSYRIGSLVRTCKYQERIARRNGNAAACADTSHTTGATVDLNWRTMTPAGRKWAESVLLDLEARNLIQATKEHGQPVYHVMVYPTYARWNPPVARVASKRR